MFGDGERIDTLTQMHLQLHAEYLALKHVTMTMISMMSYDVRNEIISQISPHLDRSPHAEGVAFVRAVDELLDELRHQ